LSRQRGHSLSVLLPAPPCSPPEPSQSAWRWHQNGAELSGVRAQIGDSSGLRRLRLSPPWTPDANGALPLGRVPQHDPGRRMITGLALPTHPSIHPAIGQPWRERRTH
jgi:hypothetical protein